MQIEPSFFADLSDRSNQTLTFLLNESAIPALRLKEAMHYSLFPGGKRLRPLLVYLCGNLFSLNIGCLDILAAAIELIHTYSLVHDDLPAMDNDDFRRGKLSCHKAFDEATAILVGDALQTLAFSALVTYLPTYSIPPNNIVKAITVLTNAAGPKGMIAGQSLDLTELTNPQLTVEELTHIHQLKTGKLFIACVELVLACVENSREEQESLREFANHLGLAFQLQDDYLDAFATPQQLGKNRASDKANQKLTFAYHYSQKDLLEKVNINYNQAIKALTPLGKDCHQLLDLIEKLQKTASYCT